MFSLQKFFGKDPQFFELLEAAAQEAKQAVLLLSEMIVDENSVEVTIALRECRSRSREIFMQIGELVVITFVTALEKEDIEALSEALYKILKPIEKFSERLIISKQIIGDVDFSSHISLITQAAESVVALVSEVKNTGNLEHVRYLNSRLSQSEIQADNLQIQLLSALYQSSHENPLRVMLIKDFYDLLEKTIDRCRDVGAVVMNITLKNS